MARLLAGLVLGAVAAVILALALALSIRPALPELEVADAATAARTRDLARTAQDLLSLEPAAGELALPMEQIRALIVSARRIQPGVRARAEVEDGRLVLRGAIGAPALPSRLFWVNPTLVIAPSDNGLVIERAAIGHLPIPPVLVRWALSEALDRFLGPDFGGIALGALREVRIASDRIDLGYALDEGDRERFYEGLKSRVRGLAGGTDRGRIYTHLWFLDRAGDRRGLPRTGSVVPYLRHVIAQAEGGEDMKAALLALTLYCGEEAFGPAIGASLGDGMRGRRNHCERTTLGGRDDLKRHFIVSAGLYAARSGQVAFGMGELKELLDSNEGGSGFSFDDIAADLAGARFAQLTLMTPEAERPALLDRIGSEADVLPPLDGLPSGLRDAEFRSRYDDVESPAYRELIAEINRRIDVMPLYAGTSDDG